MQPLSIPELQLMANRIRMDIIEMLVEAKSGHPGGSLSATDLMTALYFNDMRHNPAEPEWDRRDMFFLSKGHITPAYYSVLARAGYFEPAELLSFRKLGSRLQGHPAKNKELPGVEISSGSLGQGLGVGVGAALSFKHLDNCDRRVFVMCGDGEMQEGSIWEAFMSAAHYGLSNLVAIIDNNGLQIDGKVQNVMNIEPLADKIAAFGWQVIHCDGHDMQDILRALAEAKDSDKPVAIIAKTIKGKGVSFMEDQAGWHGKAPNRKEADEALAQLQEQRQRIQGGSHA